GLVRQPLERVPQVVDPNVRHTRHTPSGVVHEPGAGVKRDDVCPAPHQLLRVQTGAAADVEHPTSRDIADELEDGRAVVMGVVRPVLRTGGEGVREGLVGAHQSRVSAPDSQYGAMSRSTHQASGAVSTSESSRSMRPPCPGMRFDMSLTPRLRLMLDSMRSPMVATGATTAPSSAPCHQSPSMARGTAIAPTTAQLRTDPAK